MKLKLPSKKTIIISAIGLIPIMLVIGVILYNSRLDRTTSKDMSRKLSFFLEDRIDAQKIYKRILETEIVRNNSSHDPVLVLDHGKFHALLRKSAHLVEYTGLGIILALTCFFIRIKWYLKFPALCLFFVGFPVFDELVQRYSQREFRILDICIDMTGETIGMSIAFSLIGFFCTIFHGPKTKTKTDTNAIVSSDSQNKPHSAQIQPIHVTTETPSEVTH